MIETLDSHTNIYIATTAEHKNTLKYAQLLDQYYFVPIALETSGVFGRCAWDFFASLARRCRPLDARHGQHVKQQISVAIQRGNALSINGTLEKG